MHNIYIRQLGNVSLRLDTMYVKNALLFITGIDSQNNHILFAMSKFECLDDYFTGYGYCCVSFYVKDGIQTTCNKYISLS